MGFRRSNSWILLPLIVWGWGEAGGYVPLRFVDPSLPPSTWPAGAIPLNTIIHSSGSADVPGSSDTLSVQAAQAAWNSQNTSYFAFAPAGTSSAVAVNDSDGVNAILWDENGSFFAPGDSTLSATVIRVDLISGSIQDADVVFNGAAALWSTASPTPAGRYDVQAAATHEMGHVLGLDHGPILSASLYPFLRPASQTARTLSSDDRRGVAFLYPETLGEAGFRAPATGEGDLASVMGSVAGRVRTSGGAGVHGAQVAAEDSLGGIVASALTLPDGSFTLAGLPAGSYRVLTSSLNGPVLEADLASGDADNFLIDFPALYLGGNLSPSSVSVSPGEQVSIPDLVPEAAQQPETEPNDAPGEAGVVGAGEEVMGVLADAADEDNFGFDITAGEVVLLEVRSGKDGNPLDPILTLFNPGGMIPILSVDDTPGRGLDPLIGRRFSTAGTYLARVSNAYPEGGPGHAYVFALQSCAPELEPNEASASATSIDYGGRRAGVLDVPADVDWYRLEARGGDRLHAEILSFRSGSPLDSRLTLIAGNGVTILATASDTYAKDPSLDYTIPATPSPAPYFLKVESQSGSGSGAWYCLIADKTPLNLKGSAAVALGAGVGNGATDPFPREVAPGAGFDLLVAGHSLPPDALLAVTGADITVTPTSGASYIQDALGRGVRAYSVFASPSAAPGDRSLKVEDGAGGVAVLSGGIRVLPAGVPPEAGAEGPDVIQWFSSQLTWGVVPGSTGYDLYRGNLSSLTDADANGLAESYGSQLACALSEPVAADWATPAPGDGYFYLVAAANAFGKGPLGFASNGLPRPLASVTPACP